jgi:hypothetical protein
MIVLILSVAWALPWSLCGLVLGLTALVTGGGWQRVGRVLEFHGGALAWLLMRVPIANGAAAMTLGHIVIARSKECLDHSRDHELVHVAQYERWGPLFVPVYLGCSAWLWLRGYDAYLDNPFEEEAYRSATPGSKV